MKRKKGFTLVELIVSISLLAIIGISIGVSLNKVNKSQNNNDETLFINKIKSAADVYLSVSSSLLNSLYTDKAYVKIGVQKLVENGLIDKNLIDPNTGKKISSLTDSVLASIDETGTVIYDYPENVSKEDYLKTLNVYLEINEKSDDYCSIGNGTYNLVYVKNENYLMNYTSNKSNYSCDLTSLDVKMPGTYKIKYTYKLDNGVTKETTRKFIVQDHVKVALIGKTDNNDVIQSGKWATEPFTITPSIDRKANIKYTWYRLDNNNPVEITVSGDKLKIVEDQDAKYKVHYLVNGINNNEEAYSGDIYFDAKLELKSNVANNKAQVSGDDNWHKDPINVTLSLLTTPISDIKQYKYYAEDSSTTCDLASINTVVVNNPFAFSTLGRKKVCAVFVTNAGNISGIGEGNNFFDDEAPTCEKNDSPISSLNATCTDTLSGVDKILYAYSTNAAAPMDNWSETQNINSTSCGNVYYYFAKAIDKAGNESTPTYIGFNSGGLCGYVDTISPPNLNIINEPTCDAACKIIIVHDYWETNCSDCNQKQFDEYLSNNNITIKAGDSTIDKYQDVKDIRTKGGLVTNAAEDCTIGVTCTMEQTISDLKQTTSELEKLTEDIANIDFSGLEDFHMDPIDINIGPINIPKINIPSIDVCLVKGTKILLNNGDYKNIEDVDYADLLSTWNYDTGNLTGNYPGWIEKEHRASSYRHSEFSDGTYLDTVGYHGVFDCDKNEYITVDNPDDYKVGTRILKIKNNKKYCVTVTSNEIINKPVSYYHIESVRYLNVIANNFLTTDGNVMLSNVYSFTKDLKWGTNSIILKNNKRNLFTLEEINKSGYYPKYLFLAMGSANTKYLTAFDDISKDHTELLTLQRLQHVLTSESYILPTTKNDKGINMWSVTTSDNYESSKTLYEEGSYYTLPDPINKTNFAGWYLTGENKIYQPGDKALVNFATFFMAVYKEDK